MEENGTQIEVRPRRMTSTKSLLRLQEESSVHWLGGRVTLYATMVSRDPKEPHRGSSALEKLFDLTLVVALSAVSRQFAASIQYGSDIGTSVVSFLIAFFTVWNTWFPYVWFATTYDVDDIFYRFGTLGEMVGILMISDGIQHDISEVVVGYIVLRFFHVVFFRFRAAYEDHSHRQVNLVHGLLSAFVMACWYIQQSFAETFASQAISFAFLACCDLAYPYIAQRTTKSSARTKYHAHHVSERYSEFTIMVFGESLLSLSHATVIKSHSFNMEALSTCIASVTLLFILWWVYFLIPFGQILHDKPHLAYVVAYGHFFVHAPLAAFASGIFITGLATQPSGASSVHATDTSHESGDSAISIVTAAYVIAISISIFLISIPLMLRLPLVLVLRNSIVSLAMLLIAYIAPHHVSVSTLMWLFCTPVLCMLIQLFYSYRAKKRIPSIVAAAN